MDRLTNQTLNAIAYTAAGAYFYKRTALSVGMASLSAQMLSSTQTSVSIMVESVFRESRLTILKRREDRLIARLLNLTHL